MKEEATRTQGPNDKAPRLGEWASGRLESLLTDKFNKSLAAPELKVWNNFSTNSPFTKENKSDNFSDSAPAHVRVTSVRLLNHDHSVMLSLCLRSLSFAFFPFH